MTNPLIHSARVFKPILNYTFNFAGNNIEITVIIKVSQFNAPVFFFVY